VITVHATAAPGEQASNSDDGNDDETAASDGKATNADGDSDDGAAAPDNQAPNIAHDETLALPLSYLPSCVYRFTQRDGRKGPPAGNKARCNRTNTPRVACLPCYVRSKATQRKAKPNQTRKTHTRGTRQAFMCIYRVSLLCVVYVRLRLVLCPAGGPVFPSLLVKYISYSRF
jgi:hypothetical protein